MSKEKFISEKIKTPKDLAILIKKNLLVIIKISASWCGPCKNKNFLESYYNLKSNYHNITNIKFVELDIDNDSELIENNEYYEIKIDSVPTFLIAKKGCFTKKYVGGEYLNNINEFIIETINSQ